MATSPLASLFITTGVRDAGSIGTLMRLSRTMGRVTPVAWDLVAALDAVQVRLARMGNSAVQMGAVATQMGRVRREAAALTRESTRAARAPTPIAYGGGGRGTPSSRSVGQRGMLLGGGLGVGGAVGAFATFGALGSIQRGFGNAAALESASIRAAFAASEGGRTPTRGDVRQFQRESLSLSKQFRRGVEPSAALIQEIQQLGVESPQTRAALARAGISLNVVEPDVAADDAASAIFRLIKSTTSSEPAFREAGNAAIYYANAIKIAGDESAAGVPAVFEMVRDFQPIAKLAGAGADEIIALSGALADLNESQRELFRTALLRVTGKQFQDPTSVGLIGQYIGGEKGAQFVKDAATDPFQALVTFVERLAEASGKGENLGTILNNLGFRNVRDRVLLQTFVNSLEKYQGILGQIREESLGARGTIRVMEATKMELQSLQGSWQGLTSALDRFTTTAISRASPALKGLLALLSGTVNAVTASPLLMAMLLTGGIGGGARALRGRAAGGGRVSNAALNALSILPWIGPGLTGRRNGIMRAGAAVGGRYAFMRRAGASSAINAAKTPLTANAARGAGLLGLFAGKGLVGRFAAGATGRMALGALGGPIGMVLAGATAFASLTPVFDSLGDMFAELGNRGGPVGTIFKLMATVFKTMELGAKGIGYIFQKIIDLFDNKAVRSVVGTLGKGFDAVNEKVLDPLNEFLDKKSGDKTTMLPTAPGGLTGAAGTRIEVYNYSDGMGATQSIFDSLTYNAVPAGV